MKVKIILSAKGDCKACRGEGTVYDSVPYGMGSTRMPSDCECAYEKVPEEIMRLIEDGDEYLEVIVEPAKEWLERDGINFEKEDI